LTSRLTAGIREVQRLEMAAGIGIGVRSLMSSRSIGASRSSLDEAASVRPSGDLGARHLGDTRLPLSRGGSTGRPASSARPPVNDVCRSTGQVPCPVTSSMAATMKAPIWSRDMAAPLARAVL
jgi:hypothetical protein